MHLNELNLRLQGPGQTVIGLFEAWKGFVAKLDVYTRDIQTATFRYFKQRLSQWVTKLMQLKLKYT